MFQSIRKLGTSPDFSHVVIGGGVVGTAIAARLQRATGNSVLLLERHDRLGSETTARNLEVVHAGLYYRSNSLKARLCIRGNEMLREFSRLPNFPVSLDFCGKWIVGNTSDEAEALNSLHEKASTNGVPTLFVTSSRASIEMPQIRAAHILSSPNTGITSAHELTLWYEGQFVLEGGTIALRTSFEGVESRFNGGARYTLSLRDPENEFMVSTDNLINAAGLNAVKVSNMLLPPSRHLTAYFAKGSYFSYLPKTKSSGPPISRLVYPCPAVHGQSLGTHLTIDLTRQIRFGPDLEWLDCTNPDEIDYSPSAKNLRAACEDIQRYMPEISPDCLNPAYSGVRPKLSGPDTPPSDFLIREEEGFPGFINLLGIESPGLTSSPAIAEYVGDLCA